MGTAARVGAAVRERVRAGPPRISRAAGFWVVAGTLLAFLAAAGALSPLYAVYQRQLRFSSVTLTAIFAVYALGLLASLLTVGALSDHVGRRPVILASLVVEAATMLVFLAAHSVTGLLLARTLQGLATGAATGTMSAALVDLAPAGRPRRGPLVNTSAPLVGLAVGAVLAALLVQYTRSPATEVFRILTATFVVLVVVSAFVPETVGRRAGALASLRPHPRVPPGVRRQFRAVAPGLVAAWASAGLYLSLGPSLVTDALRVPGALAGGLAVATVAMAGAAAPVLVRDRNPGRVTVAGALGLAAGTGLTVIGLWLVSVPLFFLGTALSGAGFGAGFFGAFRWLAELAGEEHRAELFAGFYLLSYLALSVPALLAGVGVAGLGLRLTATVYGGAVIALAVAVPPLTRSAGRG
jgi:predicted MFS family arabinose efflux permease